MLDSGANNYDFAIYRAKNNTNYHAKDNTKSIIFLIKSYKNKH